MPNMPVGLSRRVSSEGGAKEAVVLDVSHIEELLSTVASLEGTWLEAVSVRLVPNPLGASLLHDSVDGQARGDVSVVGGDDADKPHAGAVAPCLDLYRDS